MSGPYFVSWTYRFMDFSEDLMQVYEIMKSLNYVLKNNVVPGDQEKT